MSDPGQERWQELESAVLDLLCCVDQDDAKARALNLIDEIGDERCRRGLCGCEEGSDTCIAVIDAELSLRPCNHALVAYDDVAARISFDGPVYLLRCLLCGVAYDRFAFLYQLERHIRNQFRYPKATEA